MVTLKDIASEAGVSVETVSRVLNGKNKEVWPSAARRASEIRKIARRLGFRPNAAARTMRRGSFRQIACAVTRYESAARSHDSDNEYLDAATLELARRGYSVIFEPFLLDMMTDDVVEPPRLFSELVVDGVLGIAEVGVDLRRVDERFSHLGVPTVWINREPTAGVPCVTSDEYTNGYRLARRLIQLGRQRIGYIGHSEGPYSVHQRYRGVEDALSEAGLGTGDLATKKDDSLMVEAVARYLHSHADINALICYNHLCYEAAVHEAARMGRRVPDELVLAYFGSVGNVSRHYTPAILEIPRRQMAARAVDVLLDLIAGKSAPDPIDPIPGDLYTTSGG
ncbi:MAG: LacI family transcriptional regulator [Phycisphaerae bacterium]|nr:LacI family transcriptional regulator [Phycisphaerae bacterium]